MSALTSSSAEDRLESLLKPYRDRSNAHIQAIWEEFAAEHPVGAFPSSRTMRDNSRLFTAGKRYRYALALAGYQLLTGEPPSRGLERAATWLEWYHPYTFFLDDIIDEDVRRRTLGRAWATDAEVVRGPRADPPALGLPGPRVVRGPSGARSIRAKFRDRVPRSRRPPRRRRRRVPNRWLRGRGHPPGKANPALRPRRATTRAQGSRVLSPRIRTRSPHDKERHTQRPESVPGERPSDDGGAHRRSSRRSAASPRSATAERPRGP